MQTVEHNLALAEAMAENLQDYLLSDSAHWPLGRRAPSGTRPFPQLSLATLALTLDELEALAPGLTPQAGTRWQKVQAALDGVRTRWAAAVRRKAQRELGERLGLWGAYLDELGEGRRAVQDYPREVRQRVMAERLAEMADDHPELDALRRQMRLLDARLRPRFKPGDFLWDPRLRMVYPTERFWFLYGRPID